MKARTTALIAIAAIPQWPAQAEYGGQIPASIQGREYTLVYERLQPSGDLSKFNAQAMPWLGNQEKALIFSEGSRALGYTQEPRCQPLFCGPIFAYDIKTEPGFITGRATRADLFFDFVPDNTTIPKPTYEVGDYAFVIKAGLLPSDVNGYATYPSQGLAFINNQTRLFKNYLTYASQNALPIVELTSGRRLDLIALGLTNNGQAQNGSYTTESTNSAYGLEYKLSNHWKVGAAYGYGSLAMSGEDTDTSIKITGTANMASIYSIYNPSKKWQVAGVLSYANINNKSSRINTISEAASDFDSQALSGGLEAWTAIPLTSSNSKTLAKTVQAFITPSAGLTWNRYSQKSFAEEGQGALALDGKTIDSLMGNIKMEARLSVPLDTSKNIYLIPTLAVGYEGQFLNRGYAAPLKASNGVEDISDTGAAFGQDSFNIEASLGLRISDHGSLYTSLGYSLDSYANAWSYSGGVRLSF